MKVRVLHDTWLLGRPYSAGAEIEIRDEPGLGYANAGLVELIAPDGEGKANPTGRLRAKTGTPDGEGKKA